MTETQRVVTLITAVASGLSAGVFFAFSTFVLPAIRRLPTATAVSAMQSINKAAPNPLFMAVLFGPLLLAIYLVVVSVRGSGRATGLLVAAGVCVLVAVVLTVGYHVPRNDALAEVTPGTAAAAARWRDYAGPWAAWNHVRTVAFTAATALFALALRSAD